MHRRVFSIGGAGLALLFTSASVLAQSTDTIQFGASLSLTGKLSTEGKRVKDGYDFYVKHVNEQGGIEIAGKKHKVNITYKETASPPQLDSDDAAMT
jgi:branched-chain amino acid transport system substrate-binding protein